MLVWEREKERKKKRVRALKINVKLIIAKRAGHINYYPSHFFKNLEYKSFYLTNFIGHHGRGAMVIVFD